MAFIGVYRAVYDYAPQSTEELEIYDGDLLFVLEKSSEDDWWKCKKKAANEDDDEPEGLVPNNYIEEAKPTHSAKALYDYTKQTDEELSFKEDARLEVYDETDPDWTLVGCGGEFGFAPALYIEALSSASAATPIDATPAPPPMPPRPTGGDEPIPGEADYVPPSASPTQPAASNPAAQLAGIIAQKTGGATTSPTAEAPSTSTRRALASPPPPSQPVFTPEESEEEEAPPPKPARPQSQASLPSPPPTAQTPRAPQRQTSEYIPSGTAEAPGILPSPTREYQSIHSPGNYHLYNIHESVPFMGKSKKLPTTLGINVAKGIIMISPEKSRDSASHQEWSAEKMTHYSIEGKHVFLELVKPSKSVDFHAGAKDTAKEIVAHLGELAGYVRGEGLREVLAASQGSKGGQKKGKMLYEFLAQGEDEVTVAVDDEVIVLDDSKSEEWWQVRRLKNGKEGVVPSSYVEITGTVPRPGVSALSPVEQNRLEEERLAKEAAKRHQTTTSDIPMRGSSLVPDTNSKSKSRSKRGPNHSKVRTWTDRSGTFKVDAEFIGLKDSKIHLHKLNGVKIAVPVSKMAVQDLEYVERATGASLDEDKPLSDIKRRSTLKREKESEGGAGAGASIDREKRAKDEDYWFSFFLDCGVSHQICGRYASAFARDQMGPEVLPDVNEALLRTLGLKEGDILRVMKFLDNKYGRSRSVGWVGEEEQANGGLFSGPGGALRNNTRKSRPAPAVQTNDVVSEDAFRVRTPEAEGTRSPAEASGAKVTPPASAPAREPKNGFEDNAWDVKPARTQTPEATTRTAEPPKLINDDIASLNVSTPALQPTPAPAPAPAPAPSQSPPPSASQNAPLPQGADKAIFDKIASLAPARQRPQPPPQAQSFGNALGVPPPPRASSAPGFQPGQSSFGPVALQPQLTGYQQPQHTGYQQQQQPQQTGFQPQQPQQGYAGQPNGYPVPPQQTGLQAMQQNYPALQPQPTGLNFQPQSQFGQQQQTQAYGPPQGMQGYQQPQQQLVNGAQQTGSPFADPPRQPYQPSAPSGLQNSFTGVPQQTGYQPQQQTGYPQQPGFNIAQPTGINGYGPPQPQMPPQQTGGVFDAGLQAPPAPLVAQKTGPAPPVRFGVQPGQNKLVPQPTGRANLAKATPQNPFGF